jgi:hypothetical protein
LHVQSCIIINTVFMGMTDYSVTDTIGEPASISVTGAYSWRNELLIATDPVFTIMFTIECVVKVVALGFVNHRRSYLRDPWNWVDFLVVSTSLLEYVTAAAPPPPPPPPHCVC